MNFVEMELGSALVIEAKIIGHKEANDTNLSTHTKVVNNLIFFEGATACDSTIS